MQYVARIRGKRAFCVTRVKRGERGERKRGQESTSSCEALTVRRGVGVGVQSIRTGRWGGDSSLLSEARKRQRGEARNGGGTMPAKDGERNNLRTKNRRRAWKAKKPGKN